MTDLARTVLIIAIPCLAWTLLIWADRPAITKYISPYFLFLIFLLVTGVCVTAVAKYV